MPETAIRGDQYYDQLVSAGPVVVWSFCIRSAWGFAAADGNLT